MIHQHSTPRWRTRRAVIVFCVFLALAAGSAAPIPPLRLETLVDEADIIVVGPIGSVVQVGDEFLEYGGTRVHAKVMRGTIRIDHTLKGASYGTDIQFEFLLPDGRIGYSGVSAATYRIVFIRRSSDRLQVASPYYPTLVALPGSDVRGATDLEKVVNELAYVLGSPTATIDQKLQAISALRTTNHPAASLALQNALAATSRPVQLGAAAALLERSDVTGLAVAERELLRPDRDTPEYLVRNLEVGIASVRNVAAIPALVRLLDATPVQSRRAAAEGLRGTGSQDAIPGFLHTLKDSDFDVRYFGLIGLAEVTGQDEWRPLPEEARDHEAKYIQHWRNWALQNGFRR